MSRLFTREYETPLISPPSLFATRRPENTEAVNRHLGSFHGLLLLLANELFPFRLPVPVPDEEAADAQCHDDDEKADALLIPPHLRSVTIGESKVS